MDPCQRVTEQFRDHHVNRVAGLAAQQQVFLECLGIGQMVNSIRSSLPDHRLDTTIWTSTPSHTGSPKGIADGGRALALHFYMPPLMMLTADMTPKSQTRGNSFQTKGSLHRHLFRTGNHLSSVSHGVSDTLIRNSEECCFCW